MKSPWNLVIFCTTPSMSASAGRNVVLKCHVPSTWPNPLPGTTTIPVASSRRMQYNASGAMPLPSASFKNFAGRSIFGNAYIAPSASWHDTPSSAFRPFTSVTARRFNEDKMSSFSCLYSGYDASPSFGGFITSAITICPARFEHKPTDDSLYSCSATPLSIPHTSMYPPRRPHSPKNPFDVLFRETIGMSTPKSRTTFLKDVKLLPSAYTFSWYTSSATRRMPSSLQNCTISFWLSKPSAAPVGFPGLMITSARTFFPSPLALSVCDFNSATSSAQPCSSRR
mmetsp:Transcript_10823/g.39211  ORF Transcript_10823/g.39211 Transcript_10823/m.39211 type:complete len:283 (-) Transcript_10823:777-1625(-)